MRIVAVSDLHSHLPEVPACDLLIVGGDICPDRIGPFEAMRSPEHQKAWFERNVRPWFAAAPATHKLMTWGNHDWCGEAFSFAADAPGSASSTHLQILIDEATTVSVGDREVSVWGTPWSNRFMHWAFMKSPKELAEVYAAIPEGIDILVSHQPPYGHVDRAFSYGAGRVDHLGSPQLLATIERVRPKLVICGHIHNGHGRSVLGETTIYNVSLLDDDYRLVYQPTVIDF